MGRVGENNQDPKSNNEFNDGSHQNQPQTRSTLHPQHQQAEAFPPYQVNDDDYDDQPAAFPPPPEKAHAFPPPQADQQTATSFPPAPPPQFNEQPMPGFQPQGGFNGGNMNGGMGNMGNHMHAGSPYNNPAFKPMPMPVPGVNQIPVGVVGISTEPWKSELFDCCEDPENALITACFPCVTFGQIAEIVDQGQSSCGTSGFLYTLISFCIAMPCLLSCTYRSKMRSQFRLVETPGPDWIVHCFCEPCALCQEYRELKQRGYDPTIGWMGNAARMRNVNVGVAMTPPVAPMMMGR